MLSELTDPSAVLSAAREFDQLGREQFLRRFGYGPALRYFARIDGREYDSKALAGVAYGHQFPDRGHLEPSAFSGGEASVRRALERLGFEVVDRRGVVVGSSTPLAEMISTVCELLARRDEGSDDFSSEDLDVVIRQRMTTRLAELVGAQAEVRGRIGIGTQADVPWVGLFPPGQASAQSGFYLVYLFAKDGSAAALSLNQGTEDVRGGLEVLRKRAIDLRRAVGEQRDLLTTIDLRSSNTRPKKYEAGSAYAIQYEPQAIPEDGELERDLRRMLTLLSEAESSGLRWHDNREPLHLVFKWNADIEPRTIDRHLETARQAGSVWWGRFSRSTSPSIASTRLSDLTAQLENGIPTHAYLYRRGSVWRASVIAATVHPPDAHDASFPSYYRPEDCNFFVRLQDDFEELPADWLTRNAVLANQPDSDPSRMAGALSNQTTPLFVFELWTPGPSQDPVEGPGIDQSVGDMEGTSLAHVCDDIATRLSEAGLKYGESHLEFVRSAVVALATKRFLLLTGLSGSGKSRLGIGLGQWFGPDRLSVVPVRPDWTGPDAIFGFENGLSPVVNGKHAWTMTDALEFTLRAHHDPQQPYLLLLDEMNLSHVERYFADVLSGMESGTAVVPNVRRDGHTWRVEEPALVVFPPNLFVVGTVNIDETTYMFSPKVLDRANTIEFRVRTSDLQPGSTPPTTVEQGPPSLVRRFLISSSTVTDDDWDGRSQMAVWLQELHALLHRHDREFGHRVFFEALRFGALLAEAGEQDPLSALDLQVLQKVLPRVHGSIRQVADTLHELGSWCWHGPGSTSTSTSFDPVNAPEGSAVLPLSFDKVQRMTRRLRANHFVGFAE